MGQQLFRKGIGDILTQYMLLFSLGPVQSFIAQARKTRDLWLGSFLLSALMQAGMKGITSNLIFPYKPFVEGNIPDLPNKYIAIFNTSDDAVNAARKSEKDIKTFWGKVCNDVWRKVLERPARFSPMTLVQWDTQTDPANVFELFWVVVAGDEEQYKEWLTETQFLFDRRKHLRDFRQQTEAGEKSTISGQRAALRGAGEWRTDVQTFWYHVAGEQSPRDISQDGTERLDAIDTVKRFAHLSDSLAQLLGYQTSQDLKAGFPSTSSIATASFVEQLISASEEDSVSSALSAWLRESNKLGETVPAAIPLLAARAEDQRRGSEMLARDGDCFFPETFSARRLSKEFGFDEQRKDERELLARDGPKAIATLLKATDSLTPPITRPTPYYTMIQMDGDKMGRLINGVHGREEHQVISKALSTFSREDAPALVEGSYPGRLIYAGGDDVFALAPLARDAVQANSVHEAKPIRTVLGLVDQLQQRYRMIVQNAVVDTPSKSTSTTTQVTSRRALVTASTGIAIAHHYTSLSYVRRVSKEAEQLAKNYYGRNALVVTVLRRSGEQTRVGCHWHYVGLVDEAQPIPLFSSFYDLFVDDVLSPKCVFNLLEEAPTLVGLAREAQASEIKRVLRRQFNTDKEKHFFETVLPEKAGYLVALAKAMDEAEQPTIDKKYGKAVELHAEGRRYGLVEVLGWLLVMLFLTRKEQA